MASEPETVTSNPDGYYHFLIVIRPPQSHINPARCLAYRLLSKIPSCHVTISSAISAHRRMFPSLSVPDEEMTVGQVSFIPYSDGFDEGVDHYSTRDRAEVMKKVSAVSPKSVSALIDRLEKSGRRVTCIIHALKIAWVIDVALAYDIPSVLYWIQPAMVLSTYYHYFNGYDSIILSHKYDRDFTVSLPGLFPLKIRDLPTFLTITSNDHPQYNIIGEFREFFETLDRLKSVTGRTPKVLFNSFEALEAGVLPSLNKHFELYTIGPLIQPLKNDKVENKSDMFKTDDDNNMHMKWLDSKPERSVVYLSFGGMTAVSKEQLQEVQLGLKESKLPYIWVVRKDSKVGGLVLEEDSSNGIIVEWCDQVKVLSHPSIGCFVTHHGWNSTLESIMCGVPMVGMPQWSDQLTTAKLAEVMGVGVRTEVSEEGVVPGSEIMRCLQMVMSDDARGIEMRKNARMWKEKATEAMDHGGSSEMNLRAFVEGLEAITSAHK